MDKKQRGKACDLCYKRKIKCDLGKPTCGPCFKSKHPCVYSRQDKNSRPPTASASGTNLVIPDPIASVPLVQTTPQPQPTAFDFEQLMAAFGEMHLPDWRTCPVSTTDFGKHPISTISTSLRSNLLEVFVNSVSTLGTWPHIPSDFILREAETSPLLLNVICAVGTMFAPLDVLEGHDRLHLAAIFHQNACTSMASEIEKQTPVTVLALVLLFIYCREAQMAVAAMNYRAMAIGMAVDMKLNTWKPRFDQESHYAACIAINIWWLVYIEDRWTSVLMGVKPLIDDSQCYIPLPIDAQKFSLEFYNIKSEYELLEMGVMASSSLFVPIPDPERQSKALYTTLLKTFSNVSKYSKEFSKVHGAVTGDLLCQEATLASSLLEWFSKCPRQCPEKFTYQCSFSMLTYFTAWITLYSGRIVSHMGRNVVEAYSSKEFKVVVDSAQNITQIVYAIVSENPTFTGLPRYVCHCIYVSGIIHALLLKIQPDAQTVALAQTNFNTNLVALQKMSVFSLPCMLYYKLLLQQQQQLLSLQQPLPPDFADILALPDTPDSFTRSSNSEGETQGPFEISPKLDFENVVNGL